MQRLRKIKLYYQVNVIKGKIYLLQQQFHLFACNVLYACDPSYFVYTCHHNSSEPKE